MPDLIQDAADYLTELFTPEDHVALTLVQKPTATVVQRTGPAHGFATPRYLRWLRFMNRDHYEIYSTMNTVTPGSHGRRKHNIHEIRHVYLDFDDDGENAVEALLRCNDLPHPNYIVRTSPHKFQVLWRAAGFTLPETERLLRGLARDTGADIAVTDATHVLRLVGFFNHKYATPHFVTALRFHRNIFTPAHFPVYPTEPLAVPENTRLVAKPAAAGRDPSRSGQDWRDTLSRLRRGADPRTVTAELAAARADKPNAQYYAQRTVERALALIAQTPSDRYCRTHPIQPGETNAPHNAISARSVPAPRTNLQRARHPHRRR